MKTFLLFWNPHFSSYKLERFMNDFPFPEGKDVLLDSEQWDRSPDNFDWSIVEHEKAHQGDRFFFIKVGYEKPTGLVGSGYFTSEPYKGEDWSGQGREIYYMAMDFDNVVNPASDKILRTYDLIRAMPDVFWSSGKAGVELAPEFAEKLEALWKKHLEGLK